MGCAQSCKEREKRKSDRRVGNGDKERSERTGGGNNIR